MSNSILAISGSNRKGSINSSILRALAKTDSRVRFIELNDFELPLYSGDIEANQGIPENASNLQKIFGEYNKLIISTPEYNGFFTPVLKNTFDWMSRPNGALGGKKSFENKNTFIMAASQGPLGGIRCLPFLRIYLNNLGANVIPDQLALNVKNEMFDTEYNFTNSEILEKLSISLNKL